MNILFPRKVVDELLAYQMKQKTKNESGGLLLGYRKQGALEISGATFPYLWDFATPTLFKRSKRGHRMRALKEWKKSNGAIDWIGEWHTHPFGSPNPSSIDIDNWKTITTHVGKPMTFLILGQKHQFLALQSVAPLSLCSLKLSDQSEDYFLFSPSS